MSKKKSFNKSRPISRSENMSRVKGRDTKPEIYVRKLLYHKGYRYRVNYKDLPGKPDIWLKKYNTAIFVNGCFWHMHEGCKLASIPKTNSDFWCKKLHANKERDQKNMAALKEAGIKVFVIWGCEIKKMRKDKAIEEEYLKRMIDVIEA